jgi:pimeloyl-[acyl-carrier protein] methyl ester esterase
MKNSTLIDKESKELIVFFSGWSIEPQDLSFLESRKYDVCMIHSYESFMMQPFKSARYEKVIAFAYSLGVFGLAMGMKYQQLPFDEIYAMNGTGKPVDSKFGIRETVFRKTLENIDERNLLSFQKNMFDTQKDFDRFVNNHITSKSIRELKNELQFFLDKYGDAEPDCSIFKKVLISDKDKIFPAVNQKRYWKGKNIEMIEGGHFPFYQFKSWDEIINLCRK